MHRQQVLQAQRGDRPQQGPAPPRDSEGNSAQGGFRGGVDQDRQDAGAAEGHGRGVEDESRRGKPEFPSQQRFEVFGNGEVELTGGGDHGGVRGGGDIEDGGRGELGSEHARKASLAQRREGRGTTAAG
ncbi:hypothetical protein ABFJ78_32005 [Amycolatopsis sp. MEPSY49]